MRLFSINVSVFQPFMETCLSSETKFIQRAFDKKRKYLILSPIPVVKGHFIGLFQHCGRSAYCVLTLNKFPHSSPEAPRIIQMHKTSTS